MWSNAAAACFKFGGDSRGERREREGDEESKYKQAKGVANKANNNRAATAAADTLALPKGRRRRRRDGGWESLPSLSERDEFHNGRPNGRRLRGPLGFASLASQETRFGREGGREGGLNRMPHNLVWLAKRGGGECRVRTKDGIGLHRDAYEASLSNKATNSVWDSRNL